MLDTLKGKGEERVNRPGSALEAPLPAPSSGGPPPSRARLWGQHCACLGMNDCIGEGNNIFSKRAHSNGCDPISLRDQGTLAPLLEPCHTYSQYGEFGREESWDQGKKRGGLLEE